MSGWSKQAENHILALDAVGGVEVVLRHIDLLGNVNNDLHPRILELEKHSLNKPDVVILNTLPTLYEKTGSARVAGFYTVETDSFRQSGWAGKINILDTAIVPSYSCKEASLRSGVTKPIHTVPECVDLAVAKKEYPTHSVREGCGKDKFIFYTVGEWSVRKNIEDVIRAFHLEFSLTEPVELLIKTTPQGMENPQRFITERIDNVKRGLKLYRDVNRFKRENIICSFASEAEINSIHASSDCFVSSSHGEAWCLPAMDALAFGKLVIAPGYGGFTEYLTEKNSYVVTGREDYVYGCVDGMPNLYVGTEKYFYPSIDSLRQCMRSAFEKKDLNKRKLEQARKDVQRFSIDAVGVKYKEVLEKILK